MPQVKAQTFKTDDYSIEYFLDDLKSSCHAGESKRTIDIEAYGSSITIKQEQACEVVKQHDQIAKSCNKCIPRCDCRGVIKIKYEDAKIAPLELAVKALGKKRVDGLKIDKLLYFHRSDHTFKEALKVMKEKGMTAKTLFQLKAIQDFAVKNSFSYEELIPYLSEVVKYDIVDEALTFLENNYNTTYEYWNLNELKIGRRPTNFDDLKAGLLALISLAEFRYLVEKRYGASIEELEKDVAEFGVVRVIPLIVSGKIKVGKEPAGLSNATTAMTYHAITDSMSARFVDVDDKSYGFEKFKGIENAFVLKIPARVYFFHECVHAWQDWKRMDVSVGDTEGQAYRMHNFYTFLLFGEAKYKSVKSKSEIYQRAEKDMYWKSLKSILPINGARYFKEKIRFVSLSRYTRQWAFKVDQFFEGKLKKDELKKEAERASRGYSDYMPYLMLGVDLPKLLKMYSTLRREKVVKARFPDLSSNGSVIIRSNDSDKLDAWFDDNENLGLVIADGFNGMDLDEEGYERARGTLLNYAGSVLFYAMILGTKGRDKERRMFEVIDHFTEVYRKMMLFHGYWHNNLGINR